MVASTSTAQFRAAVRANIATDGTLQADEAKTLVGEFGPKLSDAQMRKVLRQELTLENFSSKTEAQKILGLVGLDVEQLPTGEPSGLVGKLKAELSKLAKKEIYKQRDFSIAKFDISDHGALGLKLQTRIVDNRDATIAGDSFRARHTEETIAAGKPVTWAAIGGGVFPSFGMSTGIPIGPSGLEARIGFSANASVGYSVLAPYEHEWSAAKDALKSATVDLPVSAKKAKALATGSEVVLRGRGRIGATAGLGIGKTLASWGTFLSVGAHAGAQIGRSEALDLSLRIKRLDGQRVFVSLSRVDTSGVSSSVGAHIGVDANSRQAVGDLGGDAWNKGAELLGKQIDRQVERWLSADLRAVHSTTDVEKEVANYVIDLGQPEGAKAYEALVKLDARHADQLAADAESFGPVRKATQSEKVCRAAEVANAKFGRIELFSAIDSASATHGEVVTAEGTHHYDRAKLDDSYSGIISDLWNGKRSLTRELISVQGPTDTAPQQYYHFDYAVKEDDVTSAADVRRFVALGRHLGVVDAEAQARATDDAFVDKLDETDRFCDVYFTHEGLQAIAKATSEEISAAFARAYEDLEAPAPKAKVGWACGPWIDAGQDRYTEVTKLLVKGPGSQHHGHRRGAHRRTRDQRYRQLTGRNLRKDYRAHRQMKKLDQLIGALASADGSGAMIDEFAAAKDELGLDNFWLGLATIAQLAGPEEIVVNRFALQDKEADRRLVFASEGAIQDPENEINRALALGSA